jgi:hypothetical protein
VTLYLNNLNNSFKGYFFVYLQPLTPFSRPSHNYFLLSVARSLPCATSRIFKAKTRTYKVFVTFAQSKHGLNSTLRRIYAESQIHLPIENRRRPPQHANCRTSQALRLPQATRRSPRAKGTRCARSSAKRRKWSRYTKNSYAGRVSSKSSSQIPKGTGLMAIV